MTQIEMKRRVKLRQKVNRTATEVLELAALEAKMDAASPTRKTPAHHLLDELIAAIIAKHVDGDESARALAATIASALFTSTDGKKASRLHFILENGDVWGGWSEAAVAVQIEKILRAHNNKSTP